MATWQCAELYDIHENSRERRCTGAGWLSWSAVRAQCGRRAGAEWGGAAHCTLVHLVMLLLGGHVSHQVEEPQDHSLVPGREALHHLQGCKGAGVGCAEVRGHVPGVQDAGVPGMPEALQHRQGCMGAGVRAVRAVYACVCN